MLYILVALAGACLLGIIALYLKISHIGQSDNELYLNLLDKISNNNNFLQEKMLLNHGSLLKDINSLQTSLMEQMNKLQVQMLGQFSNQQAQILDQFSKNHQGLLQSFQQINQNVNNVLQDTTRKLTQTVDNKLTQINEKVEQKLQTGFADNRKIFLDIMSSLTKIDAAQKNIEALSGEVISLQDILSGNKKARGIFGEVQLGHILSAVFGDHSGVNNKFYQIEHTLSNGKRCDAMIFSPKPLGSIAIDAKFPLENYQRLHDHQLSEPERKEAEKQFVIDVKKQIDKIASAYIIVGETADHAIMFIPAEAVFAHLHAYCSEIISYASKKQVWIASPTTMMATLSTIQVVIRQMQQAENFAIIQAELQKLGKDFERYDERWKRLVKQLDSVQNSAREVEISSNRISSRFKKISQSKFEEVDYYVVDEPYSVNDEISCLTDEG